MIWLVFKRHIIFIAHLTMKFLLWLFVTVYNNPIYFNASPLRKKLPIHGTSSSSSEKMSLCKASTTKDTSISFKSVTSQPSHKCKVICYFSAVTNFFFMLSSFLWLIGLIFCNLTVLASLPLLMKNVHIQLGKLLIISWLKSMILLTINT